MYFRKLQGQVSSILISADDKGKYNKRWGHYKIIRKHTNLYALATPYVRRASIKASLCGLQNIVNQFVK